MGSATGTPDQSGKFHVDNEYLAFHLGVTCKFSDSFEIVFLSPYEVISGGLATFTPVNKVKVWFAQEIVTGTMILDVKSKFIPVDFTGSAEPKTVAFVGDTPGKGQWIAK